MDQILVKLLLYGLLGLLGQGIRVIVGLKKLQEKSVANTAGTVNDAKAEFDQHFDSKKIWLSLFVGFVAGCLASLSQDNELPTKEVQLAIITAGYAGTDFIEGLLKKALPNQ
ncbi:hypothetical protein [Arsenicibacter rosenii]|uniref:Uncharacterized protein n=1 Tax=Arsenicibacter rosenii TaxID=1750698 RepID=A0A1S2VJC0_9BACT|nr:hypothetical protein [Arsenicibacter rosenii]OIN58854.1 hypothetical protein BLX24_11520 [Arsenicibacter rosenii]